MSKVINDEKSNLIILNQYIKDLSYENFQKNGTQNFNAKDNNTNIEINVIHKAYGEINFPIRFMDNVNFNISTIFFSIKVLGSIFLEIFVR